MSVKLTLFSVILMLIVNTGFAQSAIPPHPEIYVCYKSAEPIVIDGQPNETSWDLTSWTNYFIDIEGAHMPKPAHETRAKMLWNDSTLYFYIKLEEPHIWATLTQRESIIFNDNDIEIFIDPTSDNHHYAEIEFNAFGTIMDLLLARPYRNGVVPSFSWNTIGMKHAIHIEGTINNPADNDNFWAIEIAIPLKAITDLVPRRKIPEAGDHWRINFSRVQWDSEVKNGKYQKLKKPEHNWVWSPTWKINMHRPEYWGYLQFSEIIVGKGKDNPKTDPLWNEKMQLMAVYEAQKAFYAKQGSLTEDLTVLELPEFVELKNIKAEVTSRQFLLTMEVQEKIITVDHYSQLLVR